MYSASLSNVATSARKIYYLLVIIVIQWKFIVVLFWPRVEKVVYAKIRKVGKEIIDLFDDVYVQ